MIRYLLWAGLLITSISRSVPAQSTPLAFSKAIVRLEAGTIVGDDTASRWNRTVMLAKPRIASGDITELPEAIRDAVATFALAIVATVDRDPDAADPKFRLAEVGVGYCVPVNKRWVVVHADDYKEHGVDLAFFQRQALAENERQLVNMSTIARGQSLLMFDVPAILMVQNAHRDFTFRHLIWIDSKTGKLAVMLWVLEQGRDHQLQTFVDEPLRWMDTSAVEDRGIHVDRNEFTLGVPTKRAFALEHVPPGRQIPWNQTAADLAALTTYDLQSMQQLMRALNEANLASLRAR